MPRIEFVVRGSKGDHYVLTFDRFAETVNASCSCRAGQSRLLCKHRFALMDGDLSNLVSNNAEEVAELQRMLDGTELQAAYRTLCAAQSTYEKAKYELQVAKSGLVRCMYSEF